MSQETNDLARLLFSQDAVVAVVVLIVGITLIGIVVEVLQFAWAVLTGIFQSAKALAKAARIRTISILGSLAWPFLAVSRLIFPVAYNFASRLSAKPSLLIAYAVWAGGALFGISQAQQIIHPIQQANPGMGGIASKVVIGLLLTAGLHQLSVFEFVHRIDEDPEDVRSRLGINDKEWLGKGPEIALRCTAIVALFVVGGEIPSLVKEIAHLDRNLPRWLFPASSFALMLILLFWDLGAVSKEKTGDRLTKKPYNWHSLSFVVSDALGALLWAMVSLWFADPSENQSWANVLLVAVIMLSLFYVFAVLMRARAVFGSAPVDTSSEGRDFVISKPAA